MCNLKSRIDSYNKVNRHEKFAMSEEMNLGVRYQRQQTSGSSTEYENEERPNREKERERKGERRGKKYRIIKKVRSRMEVGIWSSLRKKMCKCRI